MTNSIVDKILAAGKKEDITKALYGQAPEITFQALSQASDTLSSEVEIYLQAKEHNLAMWNLSKLSIVDDLLLYAERKANYVMSLDSLEVGSR